MSGELPPLCQRDAKGDYLDNCSRCYAKLNCAVAHIVVDGGRGPESWVGPPLDPQVAQGRRIDARAKLLALAERGVGHLVNSPKCVSCHVVLPA